MYCIQTRTAITKKLMSYKFKIIHNSLPKNLGWNSLTDLTDYRGSKFPPQNLITNYVSVALATQERHYELRII